MEQIMENNITPEEMARIVEMSTISRKRSEAYPSIEDQLDMIYWDKVNVTNEWKATIDKVKLEFPKETV